MTLEALSKQIKSMQDLRDIVTTMKLISSVSISQYTQAYKSIQQHKRTIYDAVHGLCLNGYRISQSSNSSAPKKALLVLIGSDNGMVGAFNKQVISFALNTLVHRDISLTNTEFICIGKRCALLLKSQNVPLLSEYPVSNSLNEIVSTAGILLSKIQQIMVQESHNTVLVVHNMRENQKQITQIEQLHPLPYDKIKILSQTSWSGKSFPLVTANHDVLFRAFLNEYLSAVLSGAIISSLEAEHYTRMVNMQQAEKNIDESLLNMNLIYQQERQTSITNELIDIISAANCLKKDKPSF